MSSPRRRSSARITKPVPNRGGVDASTPLGDCDVAVIGAGIVGTMITRELSRYNGRFVLLEKEPFPGFECPLDGDHQKG